ncbi:Flp pilus assembly protein CpaB [Vibrio maritimus]|uniref:Flp pilus assembly protein CpaB n=1 Tax=Vibrio maritimus TaxID=990268 RepID=UPI003734E31F
MRQRIVFVIALLALFVGVVGFLGLLDKPDDKTVVTQQAEPVVEERYVSVWRALDDLVKGREITTSDVKKEQLPLSEARHFGIKSDVNIDFNPSTLLNRELKSGELVLPEYQTKQGQPGYVDLLITEGMTLYPLRVNASNMVNDYIRPGTYVDILTVSSPTINLASSSDKPQFFNGVKADMFLTKVKVLNLEGAARGKDNIRATTSNSTDDMATIIIEVDPDQIPRLALAQRTMHIEVYRSQTYQHRTQVEVRNIIDNFTGVEELRGQGKLTMSAEGF